jgi:hypothetical protein
VTGYRVERCQNSGCSNFAEIGTTTTASYSNTGLAASTSYSYRVRATDAAGNLSGYSATASATTSGGPPPAIAFVQARYAVPQTPQTTVTLAYTGAQTAGNLNVVVIGWSNATSQVQSVSDSRGNSYALAAGPTVQPGIQSQAIYYAANIAASAASTNTVTVTFNAAASYPDLRIAEYSGLSVTAPLDAAAGASGTGSLANSGTVSTTTASVLLVGACNTQTVVTGAGTGYTQRLLTSPNGSILEDRVVTATGSYSATAPTSGGGWVMQIAVFRAWSVSEPQAPTIPTGLSALVASDTQINLSWNASTDDVAVTGYRVERCQNTSCTNFAEIAAVTGTSYSDTALGAATSYSYRVRATDGDGRFSSYSVPASATTSGSTPPTIAIATPQPGTVLSGSTFLTVNVSGAGIVGVQYQIDGVKVGPALPAPYLLSFNSAKLANGSHTVSAYMWNGQGTIYTAAPVVVTFSNASPGNPAQTGLWSDLFSWPLVAVHVNLAPNGRVLAWDRMNSGNPDPVVWDPVTSRFTVVPTNDGANLFCAGHITLPDGRIFSAGGHSQDHVGLRVGRIFDPATGLWTSTPDMTYRRWYPTLTTLPDGRVLVLAGEVNCAGCDADIPEIYDPVANTWATLPSASRTIPYYPHVFVLPNGRILVTGTAEDPIPAIMLDLGTQTWSTIDNRLFDAYSGAMYLPGKILKSGTSTDTVETVIASSPRSFVLDMTAPTPSWREVTPMAFPRAYHTETLLPDGTVLVTGGGRTTGDYDVANAVLQAEVWSPTTEAWTTLSSGAAPRLYHGTALLLPDATVLVSGGGRSPGPSPLDQENAEIFAPPYLFKGPRPVITDVPVNLTRNQPFAIITPDAARIQSVALVAVGNMTHGINMNQRFLPLTFTAGAGIVTATAPPNTSLAPPGWYMLFLVDSAGVPSVASFVHF